MKAAGYAPAQWYPAQQPAAAAAASPYADPLKVQDSHNVVTNKAVTTARRDANELRSLLEAFALEKRVLNGVNISTVLHSVAKMPTSTSPSVIRYLAECLRDQEISFGNQGVGNALYGLQS